MSREYEYCLSWTVGIKIAAGHAHLGTKPSFSPSLERQIFSDDLDYLLMQAIQLDCADALSVSIRSEDYLDFVRFFNSEGPPRLSSRLRQAWNQIQHESFIPIQCRDEITVDFLANSMFNFGFTPTPETGSLWGTISPAGILMFYSENLKPVASQYAGFQVLREINDRSIDFPKHLQRLKFKMFAFEWLQPYFYTQGIDLSRSKACSYDKAKGVLEIQPLAATTFYSTQITVIDDLSNQGFAKAVPVDERLFRAWQKRARKRSRNLLGEARSQ